MPMLCYTNLELEGERRWMRRRGRAACRKRERLEEDGEGQGVRLKRGGQGTRGRMQIEEELWDECKRERARETREG